MASSHTRAAAAPGARAAWPPAEFPIAFWCGPPNAFVNREQLARIADAGFSVVTPSCGADGSAATNRKLLDAARAAGLKVLVRDSRMPLSLTPGSGSAAALKSIVADYRKHPALLGYSITDEPGADRFDGLGQVVAELRRLDPDHVAYINLFPNYASNDLNGNPSQLQALNYDLYAQQFVSRVHPDVVSYDHYPFLMDKDRPEYFDNLTSIRKAALAPDPPLPFWQIVQAIKHGPYRALNEAEMRFQAMQTLAYGGKGLSYFTYWQPDDPSFKWSDGIVNLDGAPGPLYEPVKRVNRDVRAIERWIYTAVWSDTYQTGAVAHGARAASPESRVQAEPGADLTLGLFLGDKGYGYLLVTNRDYRNAVDAHLKLRIGSSEPAALDMRTGKWTDITAKPDPDGVVPYSVRLEPGAAALIRWL